MDSSRSTLQQQPSREPTPYYSRDPAEPQLAHPRWSISSTHQQHPAPLGCLPLELFFFFFSNMMEILSEI
ncbi:Hypothetical protein FKW44_013177 [Caligus rogercresseyi]|uniref:Uncharacterized protein n=1 Tax=Caligus rogercresseyi TaxID=217165 RepID=A0A7T8HLN7_CALRO|nr:Hypothetical protein FKW44_013177 [Caligus rogercresseyi]